MASEATLSGGKMSSSSAGAGVKIQPQQEEMPFAVVQGKELTALPKDLYIPPDALEVILEASKITSSASGGM